MSFPAGTECYNADDSPICARGIGWTADDLDADAEAAVAEVLWDRPGIEEDREFLRSLGATEFADERIEEVLGAEVVQAAVEQWRVGEAVAQAELEESRGCAFPWNVRRDLKNPRASHAGAELVGFRRRDDTTTCFAFGEVKTSGQAAYPPSVVTDLRRQLRALRDRRDVVANLVRYLTPRARGAPWQDDFRAAWRSFCANRRDYAIFGILVRDVEPNAGDLAGAASDLSAESQPPPRLELRALYFPNGRVATLAGGVAAA